MAIAVSVWAVVIFASMGIGSAMTLGSSASLRTRVWLGFALVTVVAASFSLGSATGASVLYRVGLISVAGVGIAGSIRGFRDSFRPGRSGFAVLLTVGIVSILASWMTLGEVLNYDTGLYHLQLIAFAASDFSPIGLAQLHDRFGFTSSLWAIGGQFESATQATVGFRLISGLFLVLLVMEVTTRLTRRGQRGMPGTWILVLGFVPLVAYGMSYAGRTFAGVGQDWIFAALWLVASAYLADWLYRRRAVDLGIAIAIGALAGSVRPFGWVLLVGVIAVGITLRRTRVKNAAVMWWGAILAGLLIAVTLVRDVIVSGWLLFPTSLFPVPVPWRIADPEPTAEAVTLWARSPFDMETAKTTWEWIPGWAGRMVTDWVVVWLIAVVVLSCVLLVVRLRATRPVKSPRESVVLPIASVQVVALVLWFVTAPDPRFAWGPFAVLGGVIAVAVAGPEVRQRLSDRASWAVWIPLGVVAASLLLAGIRDPSWWLDRPLQGSPVAVVPVPVVDVEVTGSVARTVGPDDRCWRTAVPCVPWYAGVD